MYSNERKLVSGRVYGTKRNQMNILILIILMIAIFCILVGCGDKPAVSNQDDYPVVGIWHANYSWHEDSSFNYGGNTYILDVYFDFREDGTLLTKRTLTLNGYSLGDTYNDWVIVNLTWTVKDNVITLSSGKTFVIVDDEFNDMYTNPQVVLRYKKT